MLFIYAHFQNEMMTAKMSGIWLVWRDLPRVLRVTMISIWKCWMVMQFTGNLLFNMEKYIVWLA